jgi:hypothetical protein
VPRSLRYCSPEGSVTELIDWTGAPAVQRRNSGDVAREEVDGGKRAARYKEIPQVPDTS